MKEHPIIFSTPMVNAILEGRKTMTRRIIKPNFRKKLTTVNCPYGQPGDILWVRESFIRIAGENYEYKAGFTDEPIKWKPSIHMPRVACRILLEVVNVRVEYLQKISDRDALREGIERNELPKGTYKHYSPEFSFSRDQLKQGMPFCATPRASFFSLWRKINGADSLDENPWVWVIEFRRIEK